MPRGGEVRILTVGESTTAGVPGPADQAYPRQLQEILAARSPESGPFRVFNMGAPAVTSDFVAARLPEYLERFRPHIVISMLGVNDGPAVDPAFQTDDSWRLVKLLRLVWSQLRPHTTEPTMEDAIEERLLNATAARERLAQIASVQTFSGAVERTRLQLALGQTEDAERSAHHALQLQPDHPVPTALLGEARRRLGHVEQAEALYRAALVSDPLSADANWGLYTIKFESDPEEAHQRLRTFVGHWPEDPRVGQSYLRLARWVAATGGPEGDATRNTNRVPNALRITPNELLVDGFYLVRESRTREAVSLFERAWTVGAMQFMSRASYYSLISELLNNGRAEDGAKLLEVALRSPQADDRAARLCIAFEDLAEPRQSIEACGIRRRRPIPRLLNERTARNYHRIRELTEESGAVLVAMQSPMRTNEPLEILFGGNGGVVHVDNEATFRAALTERPTDKIFSDLFAGDFGHMTAEGHLLLANNAANTLLTDVIPRIRGATPP